MIMTVASAILPIIVVFAFFCGVKMAEGKDSRYIAKLQLENMDLEDQLRTAKSYIAVIDTTVEELLNKKTANMKMADSEYIIEEAV